MPLIWLSGVWFLMFGIVQSALPPENELSEVDVKNLIQRLTVLEELFKVEKERNDYLERKVTDLVSDLEQTKLTFGDKFRELEKKLDLHQDFTMEFSDSNQEVAVKSQKRENNPQIGRKRITDWQKPWYSAFKTRDSHPESNVLQKKHSTSSQKRLLVQPSQVTPTTVAFYAYRSSSIPESEATPNHILNFDIVKTNAGNGYHPSTGVFIVPESGIYVFSWSFRNGFNHAHSTQLMVNNEEVGLIHLRLDVQGSITGTGIAVIHVNKGDDVFVRIATGSGIIFSDVSGKSSFSGWKLN